MAKMCKFHPDKQCFHPSSCSFIDSMGNVSLCSLSNSRGCFSRRLVKPASCSIHDLWRGRRRS